MKEIFIIHFKRGKLLNSDWLESGAHHPERPSTLYLWSNLCPDWAIFRHVFPANFCLHCGSYMTELNVEKNCDQSEVLYPSSVFLNHFCPFPRWFRPYVDRSGDGRSRETILKIVQSGHRLSVRLSMGDGRSGWWAPARIDACQIISIFWSLKVAKLCK